MARRTGIAALAAVSASWLLLGGTAAHATPVLTLPSGLLTVSTPPAAALSTNGDTSSGSFGTTTVIDGRPAATGYSVSVSTAGFDLVGPAVSSSPITHIPASAVTVQVTATSGGTASTTSPVALPSVLPVFVFTYGGPVSLVNLLSTYTMSLSVAAPSTAAMGQYTGTVTQTVV